MVLVVLSFGAALGTLENKCLLTKPENLLGILIPVFLFTHAYIYMLPNLLTEAVEKCIGSHATSWVRIGLSVSTAMDIVTDVASKLQINRYSSLIVS